MTPRLPAAPFEPPYHACIFVDARTPGDNGFAACAEEIVRLDKAQPGFLRLDGARDADGFGILISYWRHEQSITAWREHAAHETIQVGVAGLVRSRARIASSPWRYRASNSRLCESSSNSFRVACGISTGTAIAASSTNRSAGRVDEGGGVQAVDGHRLPGELLGEVDGEGGDGELAAELGLDCAVVGCVLQIAEVRRRLSR